MFNYCKKIAAVLFILLPAVSVAQNTDMTYNAEEVIVTSGRIPSVFSKLSRNVTVIDMQELKALPADNLQDILGYFSGVDLKKRGPVGVQADVSIRGGSYEQSLILVDGMKLSDPQTGHHNLNIPLNTEDIERIEILKGPGSRAYGANAFSGVINIITKRGSRRELALKASGGEYGFYSGEASLSMPAGPVSNRVSVSKSKSDGYIYNTHFDINTLSYAAGYDFEEGNVRLSAGYTDKKFGANSFYSSKYPSQWERTKTTFLALSSDYNAGFVLLTPRVYWRRGDDDYILDFSRPDWYHNRHKTYSYGAEIQALINSPLGTTALGGEIGNDEILSSSLGDHSRLKGGLFLDHSYSPIEPLNISAGAYLYKYGDYGWKFWPGIDMSYRILSNLRTYVSVGKSFRIPTFTDLYYNSPAQKGNEKLEAEEALTYEGGVVLGSGNLAARISVFGRKGEHIIDWLRSSGGQVWNARNLTRINTTGFEAEVTLNPNRWSKYLLADKLQISYSYLSSDKLTGENEVSLYALDHLKHQLIAKVYFQIIPGLTNSWALRYESRINLEDHTLADTKINYSMRRFDVFMEVTNLFDRSYMDIGGIQMPGRWITGGVMTTFDL